jgi:hypothetical protein
MLEHVAKLPCGYTATFRWNNNGMKVQWEPHVPHIKSLRHQCKFLEAYANARREFMTDVAATIGGGVLIVDMDGTSEVIVPPSRQ